MSNRICLSLVLALATISPLGVTAQEAPAKAPRIVSVLGDREPGEIRLRLTPDQLESVGIPEIAYTGKEIAIADLAAVGVRVLELDSRVEGTFKSAFGRMAFRGAVQPDGRVLVENELPDGRGTLSLMVDLASQTAEATYPDDASFTPGDRFAFRALALTLERQLSGSGSPESDLVLRVARLWGDHPLQPVRLRRIAAPREKSWTNLCGVTSRGLSHDATNHGLITETLATGPRADNCRSRCGAGCNAILGTSAWTVDCGEHDRCEQTHSCCASCQDEFNSASDDYLFASNCRLSGW
jgi:hypothetical protein